MASALSSLATTPHKATIALSNTTTPEQAARDQMVMKYLPLVKAMAVSFRKNLPASVDLDDLVHAGILGLFAAIEKFDPEKRVPFPSFARYRIRGAMLDSLRKLDWASRNHRRRKREVAAATFELTMTMNRVPAESEVAEKLGMDIDSWHKMVLDFRNAEVVSATIGSDEERHQLDFPCNEEIRPDAICSHGELSSTLHAAIEKMPARYQTVLRLYYDQDMTMRNIAVLMNVNESRICQIHKQALKKMRLQLETSGVESAMAF
jgi:RNA polymerase sigma factor FliA